jgi:hypothetical protein
MPSHAQGPARIDRDRASETDFAGQHKSVPKLVDDTEEDKRLLELARDGGAPPVDLLAQAIERARPLVADRSRSTKQRIRLLWAAAKMARDLGASDVVHDTFMVLAVEVHLIDSNGWWTGEDVRESVRRYGAEGVAHAIRWALRGLNPVEEGALE